MNPVTQNSLDLPYKNGGNRTFARKNRISFTGTGNEGGNKTLDNIGKKGSNPGFSVFLSTIAALIRPVITMGDKETPKDERAYSALWQTGICLSGFAIQVPFYDKIEKGSRFLAEKIHGTNISKEATKLGLGKTDDILKKPGILEAVVRAPRDFMSRLIKMPAGKAEKIAKSLDARKTFKTLKGSIFAKSPALIPQINSQKNLVGKLLTDEGKAFAQKALKVSGTEKLIGFVALLTALNVGTMVVTRYLDPIMKFAGEKFNIKSLKKAGKRDKDDKEGFKLKTLDKIALPVMGGLGLLAGANGIGKIMKKGALGDKFIGGIAKTLNQKLNIGKAFNAVTEPVFKKIRNSKGTGEKLAKLANVNDKWVEASVIGNLGLRLLITLPTGQWYNVLRIAIDEVNNLAFLGLADKFIVKPAARGLAKAAKVAPYNEGTKVIADQAIKNFAIVGVGMGFLNNIMSSKLNKILKEGKRGEEGSKLEDNYKNYKKRFIYANHLRPDFAKTIME